MGLGGRHANVRQGMRHDTAGAQKNAVRAEEWADFQKNQRVETVDGISGVIAAVEDGPVPGNEQYQVVLDNGLGGGTYTASQLTALGPAQASEVHTADRDYPELAQILVDRPDIAKSASMHAAANSCPTCDQPSGHEGNLGTQGCMDCGATIPYHVTVKDGYIHLDGKPADHGRGPEYHSLVRPAADGSGYHARFDNLFPGNRSYSAKAGTALGAARAATKKWAEDEGKAWNILPNETRKRINQARRGEGY
jgi:hypothetical protein